MNQLKYLGIMSATAALMLCGCDGDDFTQAEKGQGKLSISADVNTSVLSSRADSRVSAENGIVNVTPDDLSFKLTSVDGSFVKQWSSLSDLASNSTVPAGNYSIEAYYGSADSQGFESPYFHGAADVKVRENETTQVGLTAKLANAMVSVSYTDALKQYLTSYSAELICAGSTSTMTYSADETRPAYVKAGSVDIYVNITKPSGTSARLLAATVDAAAQHHYFVTVDMNGGEAGQGQLVVTFDDDLVTEDYVVDLSDELMNAPAPTVTAEGFDEEPVEIIAGISYENALRFNIIARDKLAKVRLTTTNPTLINDQWPAEIDLMSLDPTMQAAVKAAGLDAKGLWNNPDRIATIDFRGLVNNISLPEGQAIANVQFALTAIDQYGKASENVPVLSVNISKETIEISSSQAMNLGDATFNVDVTYNGTNPSGRILFQYKDDNGDWNDLESPTFTSTESGKFVATIPSPEAKGSFIIRATNQGKTVVSNEITISPIIPDNYATSVVDAFAAKAIVNVHVGDKKFAKYATAYVSTDGTDYAQAQSQLLANGYLQLVNLQPETEYFVKASLSGSLESASDEAQFTTESAPQLPNGDMETWFRVNGSTNNWWIEYPGEDENAAWGTMNLLTTSQGGSVTSAFNSNRNGCSYNAFSGTRATTDAYSGSNAAIIETVGWGAGNSATGTATSGTCKKITVGELFLGTYNDGAQYGYDFSVRPSALDFYYKYRPKNSADYGYAEISVLDAEGQTIATASKDLQAASEYTKVSLPLDYATANKASSLQVIFKSSGNADCQSISNDNLSSPSFGNTSNGRFTGSSLYIDDITLNY